MNDEDAEHEPRRALIPGVDRKRVRYEPTPRQREMVSMMVANQVPQAIIAEILNIGMRTFDRHFTREVASGRETMVARVGAGVLRKALRGNMNAARFWLITHGGPEWRISSREAAVEAAMFATPGNPADGQSRRIHFYIPENGRDRPEDDDTPTIEGDAEESAA